MVCGRLGCRAGDPLERRRLEQQMLGQQTQALPLIHPQVERLETAGEPRRVEKGGAVARRGQPGADFREPAGLPCELDREPLVMP